MAPFPCVQQTSLLCSGQEGGLGSEQELQAEIAAKFLSAAPVDKKLDKVELWCPLSSTRRRLQTQADAVRINALAVHRACSPWNEDVTQMLEWPWTS